MKIANRCTSRVMYISGGWLRMYVVGAMPSLDKRSARRWYMYIDCAFAAGAGTAAMRGALQTTATRQSGAVEGSRGRHGRGRGHSVVRHRRKRLAFRYQRAHSPISQGVSFGTLIGGRRRTLAVTMHGEHGAHRANDSAGDWGVDPQVGGGWTMSRAITQSIIARLTQI